MFSRLRTFFGARESAPPPAIPPGERIYAVGDIHGRADLFEVLIDAVDQDDRDRGAAETTVILLGDLIDRGPDSAGVLTLAQSWQRNRHVRVLMGNHEEMFLDSFDNEEVLRHFLRFGGRETLLSYPLDPKAYSAASLGEVRRMMSDYIPEDDVSFIRSMEEMIAVGDYLFVHAGIRPGVPLAEQKAGDLRWIREPFTTTRESFGPVVVHGHTIYDAPEITPNRIGIDTGAYRTGRLTALGLEGTNRWLIEASADGGKISVAHRSLA